MNWLPWGLLLLAGAWLLGMIIVHLYQRQKIESYKKKTEKELRTLRQTLTLAQRDLSHAQDIVHLIQAHMAEGLLVLDDSDKIRLSNRTAIELLHIPKEGWDSKSIFILTDNRRFLKALRQSKTENHAYVRETMQFCEKYISMHINRAEMGGMAGTIVLLIDVTSSVRAEKMRREFTANVSHELKTPLTTIKGFGEMFAGGMILQKTDVERYGAMIERESERLLFLIDDIIRLSEIEEHIETLQEPVDLAQSAKGALQILEPMIKRSEIEVHVQGDALLLRSNERYIRELFVNLIDNAIKYNNPGGRVDVVISRNQERAKIVVRDNGIGIPLQAQSRIFERFYRVDKSRSKLRGGTGLGLSIVKHIVDYHEGTIALRSELGRGTEITILLPLRGR